MKPGHERDLLRRIHDLGDHNAFEVLFTTYRQRLLYFIIGKGLAFDDAEDILQETAIQLFHFLKKETPTSFLPIALRTAKWKIGDYRRGLCDPPMSIDELEPVDGVDVEKSVTHLRTCLAILYQSGLSEVQQEALVLRYYAGCTIREVASFAEVSEDTAKARIRLAMNKIKGYLKRSKHLEGLP